jgi:hypothetical protein
VAPSERDLGLEDLGRLYAPERNAAGSQAAASAECTTSHNFNAGIAGKSGPVEGENAGEAMHLHGGHQPGVVRWLAGNLIPDDQILPNRINRRRIGQ